MDTIEQHQSSEFNFLSGDALWEDLQSTNEQGELYDLSDSAGPSTSSIQNVARTFEEEFERILSTPPPPPIEEEQTSTPVAGTSEIQNAWNLEENSTTTPPVPSTSGIQNVWNLEENLTATPFAEKDSPYTGILDPKFINWILSDESIEKAGNDQ